MTQLKGKVNRWLGLILLSYLLLGVTFILATPPLEASDEYKHYPVVQHIQTTGTLPILEPENPGRWLQEGAQPPLYYLLMAGLSAGISTDNFAQIYQRNRHAYVGDPNQILNKNLMIHQPELEAFPWHGTILAIYLIRFGSLLMGGLAVWLTVRLGTTLFDEQVGLLAGALIAFNPMFLFVSGAVNNDALANLLGVMGLNLLVWLWQKRAFGWWESAGIGLLLGLGVLSKLSLGGLGLLFAILLVWQGRKAGGRWLLVNAGIIGVTMLLVAGWWFWRNLTLYGDFTGLSAFIAVQGGRATPLDWEGWWGEFGTFFRSFWGLFGGVNVAAPQPFYWVCNALAVIGLFGWLRQRRVAKPSAGVSILLGWLLILLLLLLRWNLISPAFQGRLLFPALGAWVVLWAVGLLAWLPASWRGKGSVIIAGFFLLCSAILPFSTIRPAYATPQPLATVPTNHQFGPIQFEGGLRLVGVAMPANQQVQLGTEQPIEVTLYWSLVQPTTQDFVSSVHLIGQSQNSVGQVDRYPAWGMVPTSRWDAGTIWADRYHVRVRTDAEAPTQLHLHVALLGEKGEELPAFSLDGTEIPFLLVGEPARLAGGLPQPVQTPLNIPFADGISLLGYSMGEAKAGEALSLTLHWQATATPSQDYTVFVHLLNEDGEQLRGADSPPLNNDFPTTLWRTGDRVDDERRLELPAQLSAGNYQIAVGLYNAGNSVRLPRLDDESDAVVWQFYLSE